MKIGVVSDTHDQLDYTSEAIRLLLESGAELLLHCGDIESPEIVQLFSAAPTHFVFGNCDTPNDSLHRALSSVGATLYPDFGHLTLAGREIAWVHGHKKVQFKELEHSNRFDYLFYGHTHRAEAHRTGKTLVVNPGALHRVTLKTCLLVDLETSDLRTIEIPS